MSFDFDRLDQLHATPLKIVVVGHTNHGKTSTIRTLTEDAKFGKVGDGRTTTGIEYKRNHINGKTTYLIYDTPGFENLDDLLIEVQSKLKINRHPHIDEILHHLAADRDDRSELVYRTLNQIKDCSVVIYVIDIREPVQECYKDEIQCLQKSTVPLVVTFNYSKTDASDKESWTKYLKTIGIHTFSEFDAHARTRKDENKLFEKLQILVEDDSLHEEFLKSWISYRHQCAEDAIETSVSEICEMVDELGKLSVVRTHVTRETKAQMEKDAKDEMRRSVNKRRDECIEAIAKAFGFSWEDLSNGAPDDFEAEPIIGFDVFDASRLWQAATVAGAGAGAAIGGTIDAFVGGASFGLGTAIGGVLGAASSYVASAAYDYTYDKGKSRITVNVTKPVMWLLIGFGVSAVRALRVRGRANPHEVKLAFDKNAFKPGKKLLELVKNKTWIAGATRQQLRDEVRSAIPESSDRNIKSLSQDQVTDSSGDNVK